MSGGTAGSAAPEVAFDRRPTGAGRLAGLPAAASPRAFTFPAEFDPHQAVWLAYSTGSHFSGGPVSETIVEIARAIAGDVKLRVAVKNRADLAAARAAFAEGGVDLARVSFFVVPGCEIWMRDFGPVFLRDPAGQLEIAGFGFNFYGESGPDDPTSRALEGVHREIARQLKVPVVKTDLVSEGGAREFNGRGTMIAIEATERQRNPDLSRDEIEAELLRVLGQRKLIWLARGLAEEDKCSRARLANGLHSSTITGGHIDEMCRFVDASTVLLAEVSEEERARDPVLGESFERLEENRRILESATDQDGRPLRVLRMPAADHIVAEYTPRAGDPALSYFAGAEPGKVVRHLLAASYLNFLVTNGVVVAPRYWKEGRPESTRAKDEAARAILERAFPGRRVVQIDPENVNHGGGGIHCITQQEPSRSARQRS